MENEISRYALRENIGTVELARRLGVSASYASLLKRGNRSVTINIAKRLSALTGKPWHKLVSSKR